MNDDKHNDVWVSCCHGKFCYGVSEGAFLVTITEKKTLSRLGQKLFFTDYVYSSLCNDLQWLAGIQYLHRKKSEKLQFAKTDFSGQYPAQLFCML